MVASSNEALVLNMAALCILGLFACVAFITWYLRKNVDPELHRQISGAIWLVCLFYYRDFTYKRFGRVHFVYYLALLMMVSIVLLFVLGIISQAQAMPSPYNYLLLCGILVLVALISGLVYRLSKRQYFE